MVRKIHLYQDKATGYLLKIVNPCTPRVLPHSTGVAGHHPLSIIVFGTADTVDDPVIYSPFLPELSQTLVDPKEPSSHPSYPVGTEQGLDGSHVTGFFMVEELLGLKPLEYQVGLLECFRHLQLEIGDGGTR
ncbi:hypothetical protein C4D60_Mb01t09810 [Musa balbisiana]|uniref:Uncharacterized protein n=1 Tax=Musa balbisiana TaxID=52838 RepID=A0A4S8JLD9_MUSBA|nr:hypothetical protein C4D60_Mb01t09810 [Musa balbisiana]